VQVKAEYTNVPVQTDVRKREKPAETTNTQKHQTNPTKPKTGHAKQNNPKPRRRGSHKHQPGQRAPGKAAEAEGECSTSQEGGRVLVEDSLVNLSYSVNLPAREHTEKIHFRNGKKQQPGVNDAARAAVCKDWSVKVQ